MVTEFERLVARIMSTAFIGQPTPSGASKSKKQKKKHRLVKKVDSMSKEQKEILFLLLSKKLALLSIKGETYVYRRFEDGWIVRSIADGEPEHVVAGNFSACSCQDSRFRGKVCKHIQALRGVLE